MGGHNSKGTSAKSKRGEARSEPKIGLSGMSQESFDTGGAAMHDLPETVNLSDHEDDSERVEIPEHKKPLYDFYARHNIDPESMDYLGKGDFGSAYDLGDGRVLKETSSKSEFDIAKDMIGKKFDSFVKIHAAERVGGTYQIVMDKVDEDSDIEEHYYNVEELLNTQGLPMQYLDHFDEDAYIEEHGEISKSTKKFMDELYGVVSDYRRLGIEASDIKPDNLGRDPETGQLKAFDIEDRTQTHR